MPSERDFLLACLDEIHRRCDSLLNGSENEIRVWGADLVHVVYSLEIEILTIRTLPFISGGIRNQQAL